MQEAFGFVGLVVEDEWLLRLDLVEELTRAGWRVLEAVTGEEALALLEKMERLDFLVTDIRLPGPVDGWQVAQSARARHPGLPVIYVSANPVDQVRKVPGGIFLGKPCDLNLLLETCDRLVRG
jgi:CheY-like chemotaxis protein